AAGVVNGGVDPMTKRFKSEGQRSAGSGRSLRDGRRGGEGQKGGKKKSSHGKHPKAEQEKEKRKLAGQDSRRSASWRILVTEFQLRPVPGVSRALSRRVHGSLDLPTPLGK